jgi:hypothetical protein
MSDINVSVSGQNVTVTTAQGDALRQARTAVGSNPIDNLTMAQALAWVDANVTDLPSARNALKHLVKLILILRADLERTKSGL